MKNWKTTLAGVVAAAGVSMQASDNANVKLIGWITAALGAALMGAFAKDSNVTGGTTAATSEAVTRIEEAKK